MPCSVVVKLESHCLRYPVVAALSIVQIRSFQGMGVFDCPVNSAYTYRLKVRLEKHSESSPIAVDEVVYDIDAELLVTDFALPVQLGTKRGKFHLSPRIFVTQFQDHPMHANVVKILLYHPEADRLTDC